VHAGGTEGFGRDEPDGASAALAVYVDALALDVLKEGALLRSIDLPETEIVLIDGGHLSFPVRAANETVNPSTGVTEFPLQAM